MVLSPLTAFAAWTDPTEYGYSEDLLSRAEQLGGSGRSWLITTDGTDLYMMSREWNDSGAGAGVYEGHDYCYYFVRSGGDNLCSATLTTGWQVVRNGSVVGFAGDSYIQQHLSDVVAYEESQSHFQSPYYDYESYYIGSCLIGYGGADGIPSVVTSAFPFPVTLSYFDMIKEIASAFISNFIKPFIDVIVAEPLLFVICLFGVVVSIVTFVYSFVRITSSRKVSKPKRRKRG